MAAREEKKRNQGGMRFVGEVNGGESGHDMSRHALYKKGFSSNAVMNVIEKVGCGIEGIGVAESFDATCIHERTYQPLSECAEMAIAAPSTQSCIGTNPPSSHCSCHECGSIRRLKKRKLELEVAILAKRFEKEQ
ncbi:hypothetical protein MAR_007355 [Mya arenaria]|uniref:Uncharacterized protein n=1 Tax=Mya arenaria TaxID=6604 RepID=A0ABY7DC43_MYAAR|nr:hypothetical protein MAR_007355 [Mya arenaria]